MLWFKYSFYNSVYSQWSKKFCFSTFILLHIPFKVGNKVKKILSPTYSTLPKNFYPADSENKTTFFWPYIFFFLKDASLGNCADGSTLYTYNKNVETVICNLRQEFSILSNWFYDNYMVLNPGKCHFMLFGVKENGQFDLMCNDITLKHSSYKEILGVTIDNKLSFDEHIINICKTANKNSTLSVE